MTDHRRAYALSRRLDADVPSTLERVRASLLSEGFGVLTEIDIQATMKKKLDADYRPYVILGACNPGLAHQALQAEAPVGVLLPCNVTVFEASDGSTWVQAIDPVAMFSVVERDDVAPLAQQVRERLERALASL